MSFLIYDRNANPALRGRFVGKSIFATHPGPSFNTIDVSKLSNKYSLSQKLLPITHFVPTIWLCMEKSQGLPAKILEDKTIIKLVSSEVYDKGYLQPIEPNARLYRMAPINQLKNIYWFRVSEKYNSKTYFSENAVQWGMATEKKDEHGILGRRSIMLAEFRLLHYMGFRRIYLLGVDFRMEKERPYCYEVEKGDGAVAQNNLLYETLKIRFEKLYPLMLENGLEVFNCNPDSQLKVFPFINYEDALNDENTCLHRN